MVNYLKKHSFGLIIVAILIVVVIFTRKPALDKKGWRSYSKMGYHTYIEFTWQDSVTPPRISSETLDSAINWYDSVFSESNPKHPFYKLKKSPKETKVKISKEVYPLLKFMLERINENKHKGINRFSLGSAEWLVQYDLLEGEPERSLYSPDSLKSILKSDFYIFEPEDSLLSLTVDSLHVSMGAIVKGYGILLLQSLFDEAGIKHYLINAGGDLAFNGLNRTGHSWKIGIQNPRPETNQNLIGVVQSSSNQLFGLATSGDYENYKMLGDTRIHHLIDALSGNPIRDKQSITVLAKDALWADYYATYLFLQPIDSVLKWAEKNPDLEVFIVDSNGGQHLSQTMKSYFTPMLRKNGN